MVNLLNILRGQGWPVFFLFYQERASRRGAVAAGLAARPFAGPASGFSADGLPELPIYLA
jgi:hypothetical protein